MTLFSLPSIVPSRSLLFLGAGFSSSATNLRNQRVPTSYDLQSLLARRLNVTRHDYDLQTLSNIMWQRHPTEFCDLLHDLFTIRNATSWQAQILTYSWYRIYTSNYDDLVELCLLNRSAKPRSYTFKSKVPTRLRPPSVIHIHGYIRDCAKDTLLDDIVLDRRSYMALLFSNNPWYVQFHRDLQACDACFFVGYSLRDFDIGGLLLKSGLPRSRVYFIVSNTVDEVEKDHLSVFGTVLPIGAQNFAKSLGDVVRSDVPTSQTNLTYFTHLSPWKDHRPAATPTATEVWDLLTKGYFRQVRCLQTLALPNQPLYVIPRPTVLEDALRAISANSRLIVHSYLGNGKTVFLTILAWALMKNGYSCFFVKDKEPTEYTHDLEILKTEKRIALFFDSFIAASRWIPHIQKELPSASIIVSVRTSLLRTRPHEFRTVFSNSSYIDLNALSECDISDFVRLVNTHGLLADNFGRRDISHNTFRDILLDIYDHEKIRGEIDKIVKAFLSDTRCRKTAVALWIMKWIGVRCEPSFLRQVLGFDPYDALSKSTSISELFSYDVDNVPEARSSVLAAYAMRNHLEVSELSDVSKALIELASMRKRERRYQVIMGQLMTYSVIREMFKMNGNEGLMWCEKFYESLKNYRSIQEEPLYWLQYSIMKMEAGCYDVAESFMNTAYDRARRINNFETYQIDTHALRLLVMSVTKGDSELSEDRLERIINLLEKARRMLRDESHVDHVLRSLEHIPSLIRDKHPTLDDGQKGSLYYNIKLILDELADLRDSWQNTAQLQRAKKNLRNSLRYLVVE